MPRKMRTVFTAWLAMATTMLLPLSAVAATYYVDPATGSNANNGTSPSTPWMNPPGTRNANDSGFWSASWGAVNTNNRINCGDVILFRPGRTQTASQGGGWCLTAKTGGNGGGTCNNNSTRYYATGCTNANPIRFRIATPAEWPGAPSTGHFTIDGSGVRTTQAYGFDYSSLLAIGAIDGLSISGLDANRRFRFINAQTPASGANNVCAGAIASTHGTDNNGVVIDWAEFATSGLGICFADTVNWRISNALVHGNDCHGIDVGYHTDRQSDAGAFVDVEVYDNGQSGGCRPFNSDGIYQQGVRRIWNIRVSVHDEQTNCINGGSSRQDGADQATTFRAIWRDSRFFRCGRYTSGNFRSGVAWDGDGDTTAPHSWVFFQRSIAYGNPGPGIWGNHGSGRMAGWHWTVFGNAWAGTGAGQVVWDRTGDVFELHNSVIVPRSWTAEAWRWNSSAAIFDVRPLSSFNLYPYVSGPNEQLSTFRWSGGFSSSPVTYANASQWGVGAGNDYISNTTNYQPRFTSIGNGCDDASARNFAACDFRPTSTSDLLNRGTFFLRADSAGSGTTVTVRKGNPASNSDPELADPRNFFIAPNSFAGAVGDRIMIEGCGEVTVTGLTANSISFTPSCSWSAGAGIHLPWTGTAPDIGAFELGAAGGGGGSTAPAPPTLLSVEPL